MKIVRTIVGSNEKLLEKTNISLFLRLHIAAQTCPDKETFKLMIKACPQALIAMTKDEHYIPLHLLMQHNYRPGSIKYFFHLDYL